MCWQPCAWAIVESSQPLLVAQSGQQNRRRHCVAGSPGWLPPGHLVLGQDQEASLGAWSRALLYTEWGWGGLLASCTWVQILQAIHSASIYAKPL